MKKLYKNYLLLPAVVAFGYLSIQSATGPAGTFSANVTGAPFDAGTCNNCHFGGSWSPSVSLQLYSGATPVSVYTPGASYTVRITRSASPALPASGGFGFQLTCATGLASTNYNNWGTLPANTTNIFLSGHNYLEHTTKLSKTITQLNIPWTAPPSAAAGTVDFWIALNTVDGSTDASGDDVVNTSLSVNPNPLAVTFLYFRGTEGKDGIALEWSAAEEKNNHHYTIERSEDGKYFLPIGQVEARKGEGQDHHYSFLDRAPRAMNFYRLRQTDIGGTETFFNTISVTSHQNESQLKCVVTAGGIKILSGTTLVDDCTLVMYNIYGTAVVSKTIAAPQINSGTAIVPKPETPGIYYLRVFRGTQTLHQQQVLVL